MKESALIFHQGALGDLIVTLNTLSSLKNSRIRFDICCRPAFMPLLKHLNPVGRVYDVEQREFARLFSGKPSEHLELFFSSYQYIVLFSYSSLLSHTIGQIAKCPVFQIPPRPDPDERVPVAVYLARHLAEIFPGTTDGSKLPHAVSALRHKGLSNEVLIHPGSGSLRKNWPLENFVQLCRYFRKAGYQPRWIIGPAEKFMLAALKENNIADEDIYGDLNLVDVVMKLDTATGFVGNDSGLTHLAAYTGHNVIAVFGPSDPERWRPVGPGVITVTPEMACLPCFEIEEKNCRGMDCFKSIPAGKVIRAAKNKF